MKNLLLAQSGITAQTWITVGWVSLIVAVIAVVIVVLILIVGKVFHVDTDQTVVKILENLAGANCGGCGCSGCSGFAAKLACGEGDLNACHVTSQEGKQEIAKLLGIELKEEESSVSIVRCNGGIHAKDAFLYRGAPTCKDNASLQGGSKVCKYACLGCGDCVAACTERALTIVDGVCRTNPDACIECGACMLACPRGLIERIPESAAVYVACSSKCKGKEVMDACTVGCIACGLCAKKCPQQAITMIDNLPVIDYSKCTSCKNCISVCPRKTIVER